MRVADVDETKWTIYACKVLASYNAYGEANLNISKAIQALPIHSSTDVEDLGRHKRKRRRTLKAAYSASLALLRKAPTPSPVEQDEGIVEWTDSEAMPESSDEENAQPTTSTNEGRSISRWCSKKNSAVVEVGNIVLPPVPEDLGMTNLIPTKGKTSKKNYRRIPTLNSATNGGGNISNMVDNGRQTVAKSELMRNSLSRDPDTEVSMLPANPVHSAPITVSPTCSTPGLRRRMINVANQGAYQSASPTSPSAEQQLSSSLLQKLDLVLRNQEILKATQREHGQLLDALLKRTSPPEAAAVDVMRHFGFKLKNFEQMARLKLTLEDNVERAKLISYFNGIGGSPSNVIGRILTRVMTNELATHYCYKGLNGEKRSFKNLNLCGAIIESIRSQRKIPLTEDTIETKIKNWLRHAASRKDDNEDDEE